MTRRELLALAAAGATARLRARTNWDKTHISAITDEIGNTVEEAVAFAHQYGLQWVEIRDRHTVESRKEYFTLAEAEIKTDARMFAQEGLKVSFVNTSLLKFTWPGMEPPTRRPEDPAARERRLASEKAKFDSRMEDLAKAIHCAQWMGCDKVRVFTGNRLADPQSAFPRIADVLGDMTAVAEKENVYLLDRKRGLPKRRNLGRASRHHEGDSFQVDRHELGPAQRLRKGDLLSGWLQTSSHDRLMNVQVKAKGVMPNSPEKEDWKAIMTSLANDGYTGRVGLETHIFDGTLIAAAHTSMEEILRIVQEMQS